ncbi:hypothetical protein GALL_203740 [mine drainage metagenome]|uniref:Uncharacterized protein n=1 Tax=mine drainage metagenome TaxID=410659 RepID=A0A1J5S0C9_9ZZZZ
MTMARPSFEDLEHPGYSDDTRRLRVFFDTEFSDLVADPKLISIGLVDETGERTFYAELAHVMSAAQVSF